MIKCDKIAFSKCKYKEHCGLDAEFSEGSECEKFNRLIIYQPMTNGDHIRSMSDEELLEFLKKTVANAYMCKLMRTEPMFLTIEWIRKPAEED